MPTTPNGTPYTTYSADLGSHGMCYWSIGDAFVSESNIPTMLYAHGSQGAGNQFATHSGWTNMRNQLMDYGACCVEGDGGAVSGPYNWGNAAARAAYLACLDHVDGVLSLGPVVVNGRSMGGLVGMWLAAMSDIADDLAGLIVNSGVATMMVGTEVNAPSDATDAEKAAAKLLQRTSFYFGQPIRDAYGVSTYAQLKSYLLGAGADFCPENWDASVWAGRNILNCYGDADDVVPWTTRGAAPLRTIWEGQPAQDLVSVRSGGDHTAGNGSYLDVAAMMPFFIDVTGGTPVPEPPQTFRQIHAAYSYRSGALHPFNPVP